MTEQEIKDFINQNYWKTAVTYAKSLPHQYCLREKVKEKFKDFVKVIWGRGIKAKFFSRYYTYFEYDGYYYFTYEEPNTDMKEIILINRSSVNDYKFKTINGNLYMYKRR